jgi:hypothetical protein
MYINSIGLGFLLILEKNDICFTLFLPDQLIALVFICYYHLLYGKFGGHISSCSQRV